LLGIARATFAPTAAQRGLTRRNEPVNKSRRDQIAKIKEALEELRGKIEDLQSEEQDAFDAMPESLQQSDRGQASEAAAEALQSAYDSADEAINYLEAAAE
jgi:predicted RNase H-like nuclease (RuvC/YqgF family)